MPGLYEQDVYLWAQEQAAALRRSAGARSNLPIDWENVAEEIESLGSEQAHALFTHIAIVIEHLLKLQSSPAENPKPKWKATVRRARLAIEHRLRRNPSLRREVPEMTAETMARVRLLVRDNLNDYNEQPKVDLDSLSYTEAQVLGDWFPPQG